MEMGTAAFKWTEPERLELLRWARIERARQAARGGDILGWGQALFPHIFPLPFCHELHRYFVAIRGEPRTNTKAPRYHSKTTIKCFLIPLFQAIYEPDSFRHYLNVQATDKKANAINRSIRTELETNAELRALVGDLEGERWTDEQFVLSNGVCFSAVSAGQSIRGIHYRQQRPDYVIVDDLYNEEDIHNPEATLKKNEWFWSTLYPARAQGRRCCIHVQGTAINELDLLNKLEASKEFHSRTFKAIPDWKQRVVLWPEKNSFEDLMRDMGLMTSSIFMREMQNEPKDDAASIVKRAWIKDYDPGELVFDLRYQYRGALLGVDPSIGEKVENDYTGMALILVGQAADQKVPDYYITELWNKHWSLNERVLQLQALQDRLAANRKIGLAFIEGIAGFIDFVREAQRRTTLPIRLVDKVPDKLANLESKAWFFETGHVHLSTQIEPALRDQFIYQMTTNHPQHDDLRDAVLLPLTMQKRDAMAYAE